MAKTKSKTGGQKPTFDRPVEGLFYAMDHQLLGSRAVYALGVFLSFFSVMGLIWLVPFPQLAFLERMEMHTFLNWGSFFIAIVIYLYLKWAPTLSYAMLFTIGLMSFLIVQLEYVERDYGFPAWAVFVLIGAISLPLLYAHYRKDASQKAGVTFWQVLTMGPIWLWSLVFKKLGWRF